MPFDDEDQKPSPSKPRVGLKLNNANSMFAKDEKKPSKVESEKSAREAVNRSQQYKERAAELVNQFVKILNDKTLENNKNIFSKDLEGEVINKFIQLAIDINLDEDEDDGMGSVGLINLLLKCLLMQRDKINNLDFVINQLKNKVDILQKASVDAANTVDKLGDVK